MEAKVLRAALSAAIRVTVSSSLLGCGGATTTDPPVPSAGSTEGPPQGSGRSASEPTPPSESYGSSASYPAPASGGAGGAGMVASAGADALGAAAGMPGEAGAPATSGSFCDGSAMQACEPVYDQLAASTEPWSEPLDAEAIGCCKMMVDALDVSPPEIDAQCRAELDSRLDLLRGSCCRAVDFQGNACAPWGPPVPPELGLELRLSWGAVA